MPRGVTPKRYNKKKTHERRVLSFLYTQYMKYMKWNARPFLSMMFFIFPFLAQIYLEFIMTNEIDFFSFSLFVCVRVLFSLYFPPYSCFVRFRSNCFCRLNIFPLLPFAMLLPFLRDPLFCAPSFGGCYYTYHIAAIHLFIFRKFRLCLYVLYRFRWCCCCCVGECVENAIPTKIQMKRDKQQAVYYTKELLE